MKSRILLISTDTRTAEIARDLSRKLNISLSIYEGGIMKNGHLYAKKMEHNFDVIISMGGTASVIKKMVKIPVVTIQVSTIDFLNAMVEAKAFEDTIALVSHRNQRLDGIEALRNILDVDFKVFPYTNKKELQNQIKGALEIERFTVVAMGSCVIETAKERQLNGVLIMSSSGAIEQAIIAAKEISDYSRNEKEKVERLNAIIDYSGEGVIMFDQERRITIFNPVAEKILDMKSKDVIGKSIFDQSRYCNLISVYGEGNQEIGKLVKVNNIKVIVNRVPIVVDNEYAGMVITLQEVAKIQKLEQKVRAQLYAKGLVAKYTVENIIGESPEIKNAIEWMEKFAKTPSTILIGGETGSGKELFAQSIHNMSHRKDGPFVAINCAALPESLLESELFGYEEGAFTGAKKGGKVGLFELAHGGTIFLDEVGEIPLGLQSRLLRVLQEKEVLRIGGDYILNVDIRIIAATNQDLYKMVKEGKFREDLFFRINILNLKCPPLRERIVDIPLLVKDFIKIMNEKYNKSIIGVSESGMRLLIEYTWPGNVRELSNFVEKMVILTNDLVINSGLVEQLLSGHASYRDDIHLKEKNRDDIITVNIGTLKEMEMEIIEKISNRYKEDKLLIADKLGISRTTLWKRLKEQDEGDSNHVLRFPKI